MLTLSIFEYFVSVQFFFLLLLFLHGFVSLSFAARRRERDHQREGLRAGGRGVARAEPRPRRRSSSRNRIHAGGQSGTSG